MTNSSKYEALLERLAEKYGKPTTVIKRIVESQFECISREKMKELDFTKVETEEEFNSMKKTFIVRYLFKLTPNWNLIRKFNNLRKKDAAKSSDN